jgi:hypothetical protein
MRLWNNPLNVRDLLYRIKSFAQGRKGDQLAIAGGSALLHPVDDLRQLVQWGLVDAQDDNNRSINYEKINVKNVGGLTFRLSENAKEMEAVLEINLTSRPIFGPARPGKVPADLFMLMPFADELRAVFDVSVRKAAKALGLIAARADAPTPGSPIIYQVWSGIYHAKVIVADCTGLNRNVLYEIGIAHTLGKGVVLISQSMQRIPFDIAHLRIIPYANTQEGLARLKEDLKPALKEVVNLDKIS